MCQLKTVTDRLVKCYDSNKEETDKVIRPSPVCPVTLPSQSYKTKPSFYVISRVSECTGLLGIWAETKNKEEVHPYSNDESVVCSG